MDPARARGPGAEAEVMGREVEEAQAHLAQSSEHPPVTSTFKSTEFPGARVTPEGQTTAGRRDGRGEAEGGAGSGLRGEAPGVGSRGCWL